MKQLLQSSGVLVCLLLLVVMTAVNTCQLDNLERQVLATQARLDELADRPVVAASTEAASPRADAREDAEIRDPDNLLVVSDRPMADYEKVARGGTLRRMVSSDPRGMNPYIANGADVNRFNRWMNDTLGRRHLDDPATFAPMLATRVTLSDDGLTYDVTLRRGVMWHEPVVDWSSGRYDWLKGEHELTSDDFAFVFDMLQNEQVSGRISALRTYFQDLESYEIVDRYRFRVTFTRRVAGTKAILLDALFPSPRWLYMFDEDGQPFDEATWGLKVNEHWYNRKGIGVGPYRFEKWEPGVVISFERNDAYWGEVPSFERVVHTMLSDQASWVRKLKTGELDISRIQPEQYRTEVLDGGEPYLGQERIKFSKHDTLGYFYFGWNADTVYFSDKRVRQAMTMALDRHALVDNVFHGLGEVTTGPFGMQNPCYDTSVPEWPYDLKAAAAKLEEAGWVDTDGDGIREKEIDGERVAFEFPMLIYGSSNEWTTLADVYREALLSIGVRMSPRAVEWSTMLKKMDAREFAVYSGAWVLGWETDLKQIWHSEEADRPRSSNRIGFRNAEADRIAEALRTEFDPEERVKLCHAFHQLVHEEQPYTFIYQRQRPVLYWDWLNDPVYSKVDPYRDHRHWAFVEDRP